jgi:hypothetical protein
MIIAIWIFTLLLIGLWTLAAWGLAALLGTDGAWIDRLQAWLFSAPWRELVDAWWPGWMMATQAMLDALQALLAWLGGLASWLVWLVWGVGALGFALMGGLLTLVVVLVRRSTAPPAPAAQAATA